MKAMIIDDERPVLESMDIIVNRNKNLDVMGIFTDPREAFRNIVRFSPEVIFVDIKMPYMNGIELAMQVMKFNDDIQIVFVTNCAEYAFDAFKVNAVNYILKPITDEDVKITAQRLLKNINGRKNECRANRQNIIFSLGCFEIYGNKSNEAIKWPTAKAKELFAFFTYVRGKETDKWKLCDILWPGSISKKAEHNLHSTIYRMKIALKNVGIENAVNYDNGKYSIDFKSFYCDEWEFETFIDNNPVINTQNIYNYEKIIDQYNGMLFGNEDYVWALELREKLNKYYLWAAKSAAKYYMETKTYRRSEEHLKKVIKQDCFDEEAQALMLLVYFYLKDKSALVNHYRNLTKVFKNELGVSPKSSTSKLYKNLLKKL